MNGNAKLVESDVLAIRGLAAEGQSFVSIASRFSISDTHVGRIVRRESWR
jgi:hypothetical protein